MTKQEFKSVYDQYFDSLRRYLYYRTGDEEIASDLAQEAFIKLWEKDYYYDAHKTKSLLYTIATNKLNDHFRRNKLSQDYVAHVQFNFQESVDNTVEENELKEEYEKALNKLSSKEKEAFLMSRIDLLSYKEIAERLNVGVKAIEKRISKALGKLKQEIKF